MGVIEDETLQVVVGPGTVNKVAAEMEGLTGLRIGEVADYHLEDLGQEMKSEIKKKNNTPVKTFKKNRKYLYSINSGSCCIRYYKRGC